MCMYCNISAIVPKALCCVSRGVESPSCTLSSTSSKIEPAGGSWSSNPTPVIVLRGGYRVSSRVAASVPHPRGDLTFSKIR